MDYATISRKLLEAGGKAARQYVRAQLRKDANNRYSLLAEWILPSLRNRRELPIGEYRGEIVNAICDGSALLVWYNPFTSTADNSICDGASCFPDRFLGVNLIPGAIAHDTWYREMEKIAAAFGVEVSVVRAVGDDIFKSVNLAENEGKPFAPFVSSMTYYGVRAFGGIYHRRHIATATALVALSLAAAGCAGCVSTDFERPEEYEPPQWEKTALAVE
jgi:hypothetical protein